MSVLIQNLFISSSVKANSHSVNGLGQTTRFNQNSIPHFSVYTKYASKTIEVALQAEKKSSTTVSYVNYIYIPWIKQGSVSLVFFNTLSFSQQHVMT